LELQIPLAYRPPRHQMEDCLWVWDNQLKLNNQFFNKIKLKMFSKIHFRWENLFLRKWIGRN
jgi:hypothetical protein